MKIDAALFQQFYEKNRQHFVAAGYQAANVCLVILVAYTLASIVNVFVMSLILSGYQVSNNSAIGSVNVGHLQLQDLPNYNTLEQAILARNVFNSTGDYPEEKWGEDKEGAVAFDESAVCDKTSLPHKLLGLVYMNTPDSLVVLKDPTYSEGDVYRAGDAIIGQNGVAIHSIERYRIVMNNNGRKECIDVPRTIQTNNEFGTAGGGDAPGQDPAGAGEPQVFELSASEVETQLGPGGANLIDLIQMIPVQGKGYKALRIRGGTLFYKAGIRNNDIIKSVNGKSMLNVENGSALAEAMEEEREINVELMRGNKARTVIIKIK